MRVSGVNPTINRRSAENPLHFVSYDILFEYHASTHAGGCTQIAFVQGKNDVNQVIRGQETDIPRHVFRKAYEIFLHSIIYDKELAWGCDSCPKPLSSSSSKREAEFADIECHISDGINMGTIENDIKGFAGKEIFEEEVDSTKIVKGIEAKDRTLVNNVKQRKILQNMLSSHLKNTRAKIDASKPTPFLKEVSILLQRLETNGLQLPAPYHLLFKEISKCTPIAVLLPSHDDIDYRLLEAFLNRTVDIFGDYSATKKVTEAFPVIIRIIKEILDFEKCMFLPKDVSDVFHAIIALKNNYNKLARERAVPRKHPTSQSPAAQVYPFYPAHSMKHTYAADSQPDKTDDTDECNKIYNESSTITGGITHLTCNHSIVKGFTAMKRGESVEMIVNPLVSRLPQRVQARRRFLLYDNACQARKYAERRYPHRVRNWTFLVDRKHWDNHTACSQAFCMDEYPSLKKINSQVSEQTNRSLRKLSVVLAYYGWENYLRVIELFFVARNLKIKGKLI